MAKIVKRYKRSLHLGRNTESGKSVFLGLDWFETHLHVLGPPGSGKTRLLLSIFQQLCRDPRATIVLLNPKGALARNARDWAIGHGQSKRLIWFDPADPEFVMGYNPLSPNGLPVATHAKAVRESIRSAWGQSSFDETPQLARLLYLAIAISISLRGTLLDALRLLRSGPSGDSVRRTLLSGLASSEALGERDLLKFLLESLTWFDSLAERRQEELSASSLARLESFVCDPVVGRVLMQPRCLDLGTLIADRKILLVNLEIGRSLRMDDLKLFGRFIVNDLVNHVFSRKSSDEPVYLILDEVQNFATHDLCSVLDMGRELGLHCVLAHQNLGQLRGEEKTSYVYDSVTKCARTKFYFGGLGVEDLEILVKDACIEEYDSYKVKDELTTLSLDPIESQRDIVTHGRNVGASAGIARGKSRARNRVNAVGLSVSKGKSSTHGESSGTTFSSGHVSGSQFGLGAGETMLPSGEIIQTSSETDGTSESYIDNQSDSYNETHTRGTHHSQSIQTSHAEGEARSTQEVRSFNVNSGESDSVSRTPFYEYMKEYRVSSRTFESEQEFLTSRLQKIKGQPQAHAFLKVPGVPGRFLALPWVRTPWISGRAREVGLQRVFDQPFYTRRDELIELLPKSLPILLERIDQAGDLHAPAQSDISQFAEADEQFAGPEVILKPRAAKKKKR